MKRPPLRVAGPLGRQAFWLVRTEVATMLREGRSIRDCYNEVADKVPFKETQFGKLVRRHLADVLAEVRPAATTAAPARARRDAPPPFMPDPPAIQKPALPGIASRSLGPASAPTEAGPSFKLRTMSADDYD